VRLDHITQRTNMASATFALSPFACIRFNGLPDDDSELEPPDPIPNSAVKRLSADGSVGFPHVRVGHRQAFITQGPSTMGLVVWAPIGAL
jgi:hypothetical protein